jgi:hypothetical protein
MLLADNISNTSKLNFITSSLPIVCVSSQETKQRIKRLSTFHTLSRDEKMESIIQIRYLCDQAKKCYDNINNASDDELLIWLNKTSRYIQLFTKPFIK